MIHYFYYTDYRKLADLGFHFHSPRKERNTYISYLQNPIYFTLPKSEILEIYECNVTEENRLKYVVDVSTRQDLSIFLNNLDKLCIELSYEKSNEWFKKSVPKETLGQLYYSIYGEDKEEHNEQVMEIIVDNEQLLDKLVEYNRSDTLNLMVCIKGIEFFKSSFKWYITLEKLVSIPTSVISPNKNRTINLDDASDYSQSDNESTDGSNESGEDSEYGSDSDDGGRYKSDSRSTAKDIPVSLHRMNRSDLEHMIREKTEESKKLFLNSERVRKTADIIYRRAIQLQNEVTRCKEQLRSMNESK
jgi:hypothetical protein